MEKETWIPEDEARVAAEAERPVRELAREAGVDSETKAVFDKRAEQRGDEALATYREGKESRSGLVNPELAEIKQRLSELNGELESELGLSLDSGRVVTPYLAYYQRDENGELTSVAINDLVYEKNRDEYVGVGPLGEKLKVDALNYGRKGRGDDGDKYILDAYKYDPETRVLIDRFIELNEKINEQKKRTENIIKEKKARYEDVTNINAFLQRIGYEKSLRPDTNLSSTELYDALTAKDGAKVDALASQIRWALEVFDGLTVSPEVEADVKPDLDIIQEELAKLISLLSYSRDNEYPKDKKESFTNAIKSTAVGQRYFQRTNSDNRFLYTVVSK